MSNGKFRAFPLGDIVREQQEHERRRARQEVCGFEFYQQVHGAIVLNEVPHAGTVRHICSERAGHQSPESPCRCSCGVKNRQ